MQTEMFLAQCQQETAALRQLLSLLEDEQRAIIRFDAIKLDSCTQGKQQQLLLLQDMKNQRQALLSGMAIHDKQAFMLWLANAEPAVRSSWMALELALAEVQALNDNNAAVAQERMAFASSALQTLQDEAKAIDGYGRDGNFAATSGMSRRLGSA